jgi:putative nucleotidyltransferase with HDIG domain
MQENHKHNGSSFESSTLDQTKQFVVNLMTTKLPEKFVYHNLEHTMDVVQAAEIIASHCNVPDRDFEVLLTAAYLHDIGYTKNNEKHEDHSITLAKEFLSQIGADQEYIDSVIGCIEATKMPQNPKNLIQKVLCDADLFHLSSGQYFEKAELLRHEFSLIEQDPISESEWLDMSSVFIDNHQYWTDYGKQTLAPQKAKNRKKIKKRLKALNDDSKYVKELEKKLAKLQEKENRKPTRGIETMFRITSENHMTLSGMADTKANIMISINSIILSILVGILIRKFEEYPNLILPTLIIVVVCLCAIVFAILATRPNITSGKFTREDINLKRTNLLFFGNFHRMKLTDYTWGMKEMLKDSDYLYGSLIKDIYFLGVVLGKKYRFLRISYTVFMFGFVIAILSFFLAIAFPNTFTPSIFIP